MKNLKRKSPLEINSFGPSLKIFNFEIGPGIVIDSTKETLPEETIFMFINKLKDAIKPNDILANTLINYIKHNAQSMKDDLILMKQKLNNK